MKKVWFITNFDNTIQNTEIFGQDYPSMKLTVVDNTVSIMNEDGEEIDTCTAYESLEALKLNIS